MSALEITTLVAAFLAAAALGYIVGRRRGIAEVERANLRRRLGLPYEDYR